MNTIEKLRSITPTDLAQLGMQWVAYIKPVEIDGTAAFGIFAADGKQLAIVPTYETAIVTARQNDLEPVTVH
ncbi:MAG TPA: DUF1150 family protein [Verrucomicrobiae bacterium]|nr:DUF1150 family protein [Verrucomicrobiae bacterium]